MTDQLPIDNIVVLLGVVYYAFLCLVYILRAYEKNKAELMLAPVFSLLLIPFTFLFVANLLNGSDMYRLITLVPMLAYLTYDFWYRLLTRKKPLHHPEKWPAGLVAYILLLNIGSIGLNWYGYIVSKTYGHALVVSYFIMLGFFGFYQGRHNKRKNAQP